MDPDHLHTERLKNLDLWGGPVAFEPIPGGITNRNYRARVGTKTFVARIGEDRPLLGIDRRNEVVCQRAAHALGVGPAVVHHEPGVLVSEHLEARTQTTDGLREPTFLPRIAALLRRLHDGRDRLVGETLFFSAFQTVRTYAATARSLGATLPDDAGAILDDARDLARRVGPFVPALCHNDVLAGNVLDDGARLWLVDWEYGGVGHPLFDLANLAGHGGYDDARQRALLAAYRGTTEADPADLQTLRLLKVGSLLREAFWSLIQTVASDLAFDFRRYADDQIRAYREARRVVDGRPPV